jgi:hypothetical protein
MKIESLARPGLIALGVAGIGATALLGFAAGMAVSRDPEAVHRTLRRVAGAAAFGLERARLMAAQAREHVGDLWAEAREAAVADVDETDFSRAAARASKTGAASAAASAATTAEVVPPSAQTPTRKRATRARKALAAKPKAVKASGDEVPEAG